MSDRIQKLIKQDTVAPDSVIQLLNNTFIGTNGTLYQLLDTKTKVHHLHQPHFFYLERNGQAFGNVTFCKRQIAINNHVEIGYYIRYVAFEKKFQSAGKKSNGNSHLHAYFKRLIQTSNLDLTSPEHKKSIFWAYIDPDNLRSLNLNKTLGMQPIGTFTSTVFSRVKPVNRRVVKLNFSDQPEALSCIKEFYASYALFTATHLFKNDHFYVLKENDKIVCGLQANPSHWKIKSLPGLGGKIMLKIGPFIPRIKKLINPKNHRFLNTEGLFWRKEHEHHVKELLEGTLALTKHHSLIILEDTNHARLNSLKIKWGFIQNTKKNNAVHIVAKLNGFNEQEISTLIETPKYLSGFDVT